MGELSSVWRESNHRYRLVAHKCGNCSTVYFPPRDICLKCHRESIGKMKEFELSGKGEIESFTVVHDVPPAFVRQRPYFLALIKLDEGPTVTAQIVDCEASELEIGKRVRAVFRRIREDGKSGVIEYGYKFVLQ
ncbi:MAG: Zn-ribbon domain-containing OB-fold protein [Candidatus Thermoplasmatota archaeon]|nr:Zn-ribbon domain-containing OB-fold protein [Candidatus Thermoplasmatota archaeon]